MWALFPDAVGAGGDGLISVPPKNCIFLELDQNPQLVAFDLFSAEIARPVGDLDELLFSLTVTKKNRIIIINLCIC